METFSALLTFCVPHTKASDAELWCFFDLRLNQQLSKQSKYRDAGDLRRHRVHYGVTVMNNPVSSNTNYSNKHYIFHIFSPVEQNQWAELNTLTVI